MKLATDKQLRYITFLCGVTGHSVPSNRLAIQDASNLIQELLDKRAQQTDAKDYSNLRNIQCVKERIASAKTLAGGFTRKGLESLGVSWPPKSGWLKRLERGCMCSCCVEARTSKRRRVSDAGKKDGSMGTDNPSMQWAKEMRDSYGVDENGRMETPWINVKTGEISVEMPP